MVIADAMMLGSFGNGFSIFISDLLFNGDRLY